MYDIEENSTIFGIQRLIGGGDDRYDIKLIN